MLWYVLLAKHTKKDNYQLNVSWKINILNSVTFFIMHLHLA